MRVYTNKDKDKVLKIALKRGQQKISLWKSDKGIWHAALGPENVPDHVVEVEHVK